MEACCISSLSFYFFGLVQAQKSLKKPENHKAEKLSGSFKKAGCFQIFKKLRNCFSLLKTSIQ